MYRVTPPPIGAPSQPDRADVVIRPPILWILLVAAGVGLDWIVPLPFMPEGVLEVWLGILVWLAGFALAILAMREFRRAGTEIDTHSPTAVLVQSGVFSVSRNPVYLGMHIGTVGAAVAFDSLWVLATLVPLYLITRYGVVAREETYLERKFGDAYRAYKRRVRRWL